MDTIDKYSSLFEKQKANQYIVGNSSLKQRKAKLSLLKKALEGKYKEKFHKSLQQDLKKPIAETNLLELYPVISEIKFAKKNLRKWMEKQPVSTPISLVGSSSWIKYEPKGVCLIMAPWNYPIVLTLSPLVSALAGGNTVIIKPSEITPNTSAVLSELISELFEEDEVALIEGDVDVATELLKLPFNHIHFTGAPAIGKIVMKAAAKHLASVTLELGGKSPAIVDVSANITSAAQKIVWGKFVNCGQTCIAPDYILVHESIQDKIVDALKIAVMKQYSSTPEKSNSYGRIVSKKHFNRLVSSLEDAKANDATVELGGEINEKEKYISPTILTNVSKETRIMQEEIFGPILPVMTYKNTQEIVNYMNEGERPLALYIYSKSLKFQNFVINNTRAGTTSINNNVVQHANPNLPFGGVNNSGIGKTHGFYGFQEFSNLRSVLKQYTYSSIETLFAPYNKYKQRATEFVMKWF